jgi:cell wall-associated NlpC family hydrolase
VVEVSYGTRLPVVGQSGGWLRLGLPGGVVRRVDPAVVVRHGVTAPASRVAGVSVARSAQAFTGLPYLWAGRSGFGVDCSGLASLVYRVHGLVIPRDAGAQAARGRRIPADAALPGDLLFYATASGRVHHVSVYVGSGLMVHAPGTGQTVQTIPTATEPYATEFAGARRYLP